MLTGWFLGKLKVDSGDIMGLNLMQTTLSKRRHRNSAVHRLTCCCKGHPVKLVNTSLGSVGAPLQIRKDWAIIADSAEAECKYDGILIYWNVTDSLVIHV